MTNHRSNDGRLLRLAPQDNVFVAIAAIEAEDTIELDGQMVTMKERIPLGFKVAARPIGAGEKIIKYGAPIGSATRNIEAGERVHMHNMKSDYLPTYTLEGGEKYDKGH